MNIFDGTYTKDMVMDPPVTVNPVLSEDELDIILQKMVQMDFIGYPDNFSVEVASVEIAWQRTPYTGYYFMVEYSSRVKEPWWDDKIISQSQETDRLRELVDLYYRYHRF